MSPGFVIVTGASRGIGAAIALELAQHGFEVGCLSRSGDLPANAGIDSEVTKRLHAATCDVTDAQQLRQAIHSLATEVGQPVTGLVNNAGLHTESPSATLPAADFMQLMEVNALSVLHGSQAVYPLLKDNGGGIIVNIGSFFDKLGVKRNVGYCASKAAVGAITRCLAVEWASAGISVLNVAPGYIVTDLNREAMAEGPLSAYLAKRIPRGKPGDADDIGRLVTSLFVLKSGFLSGETLYIDGAQAVQA